MEKRKRILVWDVPVRLFHWLLALGFLAAFVIAILGEHSPAFAIHMLLGLVIGFMLVLRMVWGVLGTRHARFKSFAFGPKAAVDYLKGAITGSAKTYVGHNPGSAYAIGAMLILLIGLIGSGILMSGGGEIFEEVHEVLAWMMMAVVGAHILGIVLHTVRHREAIAMSMLTGRKQGPESQQIQSARPFAGAVFLFLVIGWSGALYRGFDFASQQVKLPLLGTTLLLGEGEDHNERDKKSTREGYDEEADD